MNVEAPPTLVNPVAWQRSSVDRQYVAVPLGSTKASCGDCAFLSRELCNDHGCIQFLWMVDTDAVIARLVGIEQYLHDRREQGAKT